MKKRGRKAQLTMFVILGLVLLLAIGLIYLLVIRQPSVDQEFREESVPEEFKPFQNYVAECILQAGGQGIKELGAHGGYINPENQLVNPEVYKIPEQATRHGFVSLTGETDDLVPYYLHVDGEASYLNYDLGSMAPTVEYMEYHLSEYIKEHLPDCIAGYEELENQAFDISADNQGLTADVNIKEDTVEFLVNYRINLTGKNTKTTITRHKAVHDFPLRKYYELSVNLMAAEMLSQFMESYTRSLIEYYSGADPGRLPPIISYTNAPYVITWSEYKVANDMDSLLSSYTPVLQLRGTKDYDEITVDDAGDVIEAGFYNSLSLNIFNNSMPGLSELAVNFYYPQGTLDMEIAPSQGSLIKPEVKLKKGNQNIPQSQWNKYEFYYDIAYPVIVEIRGFEPGSRLQEFSYLFALETNIIENKPVMAWNLGLGTVDWDSSYLNVSIDIPEGSVYDSEGNTLDFKQTGAASKSLFCDQDTWASGRVVVRAGDADTSQALEGASVSYGCGDHAECWVGSTDKTGAWSGKLPVCIGGYLSISKQGYGSKTIQLSTEPGKNVMLPTKKLHAIKKLNASIQKIQINKVFIRNNSWGWEQGDSSLGQESALDPDYEQAILSIIQKDADSGSNPIANHIIFGREGVEKQEISLVPGEYEIELRLIDYEGLVIPRNCSRVCSDRGLLGIGCTNHTYYPEEPVEITPAPWGGAKITKETTGYFRVTAGELKSKDKITFKVLKLPDLSKSVPSGACLEALQEMSMLEDYSAKYKDDIWPVIE